MTQAGGPAAINGFLYQILHHLGSIADAKLTTDRHDPESEDGLIILEPITGGDAIAAAPGKFIVEQYKTKADGKWSTTEMVEEVLRDLRRAVPTARPANAKYRFVTNAGVTRLEEWRGFGIAAAAASIPEDLNDEQTYRFSNTLAITHRQFFSHIVKALRPKDQVRGADDEATILHLLARFEISHDIPVLQVQKDIDAILRRYAVNAGDEIDARLKLTTLLMNRIAEGELRLNAPAIDCLLAEAGLNPTLVRRYVSLRTALSGLLEDRLQGAQYRAVADIRAVPNWPDGAPVIVIAGDSGFGKTWQLASLARSLASRDELVTWTTATRDADQLLKAASEAVWIHGLHNETEKPFAALHLALRRLEFAEAVPPRLNVAIDDVQDFETARNLVSRDWVRWGMRLALTVPAELAERLEASDPGRVHVQRVGEFSIDELDQLLRLRGQSWADLPDDLKKLLRLPILAGIYLELPHVSFSAAPHAEYELFEGFRKRITGRAATGDEATVEGLAARVLEKKSYPLPRVDWSQVGIYNEQPVDRLKASGWLQVLDDGSLAFAHDRLLNWIVAEWLAGRVKDGMTVDQAHEIIAQCGDVFSKPFGRNLGYVPMDFLWLLSADNSAVAVVADLVEKLESGHLYGSYGEDLYEKLLPTLGGRAIPILSRRLDKITAESPSDYRIRLIGDSLLKLATHEDIELVSIAKSLLESPQSPKQQVAMRLLSRLPNAALAGRIWELHRRALAENGKVSGDEYRSASMSALSATAEVTPQWLRTELASVTDPEAASDLVCALEAMSHATAKPIWDDLSDLLMARLAATHPRRLLECISRFRDLSKRDFVIDALSREDDHCVGSMALAALAQLDPDLAIESLPRVPFDCLARNDWFSDLMQTQPEALRRQLHAIFQGGGERVRATLEMLFGNWADELGAPLLRFYLQVVKDEWRAALAQSASDPRWVTRPMDFLGKITRPELLQVLWDEVGGELEALVTQFAARKAAAAHGFGGDGLESARRLLILMSGNGISDLIHHELASAGYWQRRGGVEWAMVARDAQTIELLDAIASKPLVAIEGEITLGQATEQHFDAVKNLAALGADPELVHSIEKASAPYESRDLSLLRDPTRPMDRKMTANAVRILGEAASTEDDQRTALFVLGASADPGLAHFVRPLIKNADPESKLAALASDTLRLLRDRSDETLAFSLRLLASKENWGFGVNALLGFEERGRALLVAHLRDLPAPSWRHETSYLLEVLHDHADTRDFAVEAAATYCRDTPSLTPPYKVAALAPGSPVRDEILEEGFGQNSINTASPLRAIEGLAETDVTLAMEAIVYRLRQEAVNERELCERLATVAPGAAAGLLVDLAATVGRDSLVPAAGRALRLLDSTLVDSLLSEQTAAVDFGRRAIAAQIAGWLPSGRLQDALERLTRDVESRVRAQAIASLRRHRRESTLGELYALFPDASWKRRWAIVLSILSAGDPFLIAKRSNPLWLGNILSDVPYVFASYAKEELERLQKDTK